MRKLILIVLAMLPLCLVAQRRSRDTYKPAPGEQTEQPANYEYSEAEEKEHKKVVTGFSGGMMLHGGYLFASSPDELFRNGSLTEENIKDLPRDGFTMGLGGTLRLHLIDHIHIGGEGHMSYMPLTASGTSVRAGWGGVICDFYGTLGIVKPLIGMCIGGGATRRLYVPEDGAVVEGEDNTIYNASFTKTPYFMLDPYVGLEFELGKISLILRADYMLPFGTKEKGLANVDVKWSNFVSPSGPRLYFGVLFGH